MLVTGKAAHVAAHLRDHHQSGRHINAINAGQIHTAHLEELGAQIKLWRVASTPTFFAFGGLTLAALQDLQLCLNLTIAFQQLLATKVKSIHRLLESKQVFTAPVTLQALGNILGNGVNARILQLNNRLPDIVVVSVQEQLKRIDAMQEDIDGLSKRLVTVLKQNQQMLAVQAIPGVGPLTATALVASVGDVFPFKSGRHFASWLGLTPRQVGTGGKTQQLGISKRGDTYLRTLLIAGARSIVGRSAHNGWIERLLQRRHFNVVVAAVANKMARTVWAVLAKGAAFDQVKWSPVEPVAV